MKRIPSLLLTAAVAAPAASLLAVPAASAAGCTTIDITGTTLSAPSLSPSAASGVVGGCVLFDNTGHQTETVSLTSPSGASALSTTLTSGKTAQASLASAGTYAVKVTTKVGGLLNNSLEPGSGTIKVSAPSSSGSTSGTPAKGGGSSGSHHHASGGGSNATRAGKHRKVTGPDVAPGPKSHHRSASGNGSDESFGSFGSGSSVNLPPIPALGRISEKSDPGLAPDVAPKSSSASVGTPETAIPTTAPNTVQVAPAADTHNSSKGLPSAIAALLILGVASAYARAMRMRRTSH